MRTALIAAAAGFGISLLLGLIAGNPFGIILLRSLLSAAGLGGAVFGIGLIIRKFLPELVARSDTDPAAEGGGMGEIINIVSDKDDDETAFYANQTREPGDQDNLFAEEARASLDEVVEEVTETNVTALDDMYSDPDSISGDEVGDNAGPLPDIAGFESSFGAAEGTGGSGEVQEGGEYAPESGTSASPARSSSGSQSERLPNGMDPALIAKALSTALKRSK